MKPKIPSVRLLVDHRERKVIEHKSEWSDTDYSVCTTMQIGDYALVSGKGEYLALLERKTLPDFAASIKDGKRINENMPKMLDFAAQNGGQVIFIIEGMAYPAPSTRFGGIPWANMESCLFHHQMRDGVSVIRTKDARDTAAMLARMVKSANTLLKVWDPAVRWGPAGSRQEQPAVDTVAAGGDQEIEMANSGIYNRMDAQTVATLSQEIEDLRSQLQAAKLAVKQANSHCETLYGVIKAAGSSPPETARQEPPSGDAQYNLSACVLDSLPEVTQDTVAEHQTGAVARLPSEGTVSPSMAGEPPAPAPISPAATPVSSPARAPTANTPVQNLSLATPVHEEAATPRTLAGRRMRAPSKAPVEHLLSIWCKIDGVGPASAKYLAGEFALAEVLCGEISHARVAAIRTPDGKKISSRVADALVTVRPHVRAKIIAAIPGVSEETAKTMVEQMTRAGLSMANLVSDPKSCENLTTVSGHPIGLAKLRNIAEYLKMKGPAI